MIRKAFIYPLSVVLFFVATFFLPLTIFAAVPVADFTGAPTIGCGSVTVSFTNTTVGGDAPLSYQWIFSDREDFWYAFEENPIERFWRRTPDLHYYASVRLIVTDADGDVDVMEKFNYIRVDRNIGPGACSGDVNANFSALPATGDAPLTVNFTNTTTGYTPPFSYEWDFDNDGVVDSTETNPTHTYNSVGTYTVKLKATDPYGRTGTKVMTDFIFVKSGSVPVADFTGTPTSGSNPLTVNFTNATTGGDAPMSYEWDFDNDGVVDSTDSNPSHIYTSSGYFTVQLRATDIHGDTHTVTKQNYIFVTTNSVPVADFIGAPTGGCNQVTVNFTGLTTGGDRPLSYYWQFEIGGFTVYSYPTSSTEQNPTVIFEHYSGTNPTGYASVRLTVTDADGDVDVIEKVSYIRVDRRGGPGGCGGDVSPSFSASPTTGDAPLTVNFTNTTTGYTPPFSHEWDFDNDGVVDSTDENPSHTYNSVGTYTVKLKATDPYGRTGTKVMTDYIFVKIDSVPVADFTGTPTSGSNPLTVNFTNATTGGDTPMSYEWDFDNDGVVDSIQANPSHTYTSSGNFTVKLKVTDVHGDTHTVTKQNFVFVTTGAVPVADFTSAPTSGCSPVTVAFTNKSSGGDGPLTYQWVFWDERGFTDMMRTEENPVVTLWHDGSSDPYTYINVLLIATDADGESNGKSGTVVVYNRNAHPVFGGGGCTAGVDFSAFPVSGLAPLTVNFTNLSSGFYPPISYQWDFDNDGVVDSTVMNPVHTYSSAGTYSVKLTVTDMNGTTNTKLMTDYISVTEFIGDIAAGHEHTLFIKPDNTLWAWGRNDAGQLGDGTTTDRLSPVRIGTDSDWVSVSAGWRHSIATKRNGTLWAWGNNTYAQLGDGTRTSRLSPVQIGSNTDWSDISAGGAHNLALKTNGTLWAWGLNSVGQIGNGTTTDSLSLVQIGIDSDWSVISSGWEHSTALKSNKAMYTWGWNISGQLGDDTKTDRHSPVQIGTANWVQVSAGWMHTVALRDNDTLYAWGDNDYGQLGDGTITDRLSPVLVGGGISNSWIVTAGGAHTMVLTLSGELWAWGLNSVGQIGDGTTTMRLAPVLIGSISDWDLISAGWEHTAAMREVSDWDLISAGWEHTAAMREDGSFWIWGWNAYGQLGDSSISDSHSPITLNVPIANFTGSPLEGYTPLAVTFLNMSGGLDQPFSNAWDFDNDGTSDSTFQNPIYIYSVPGIYSVRLSVMDSDINTDSILKTNYVTACYPPVNIMGDSTAFISLQTAYIAAQDLDIMNSRDLIFTEDLFMNRPISVTFNGGCDCLHYIQSGTTVVNGNMTVSSGLMTIQSGTLEVK